MRDLFGQALLDYYHGINTGDIITSTNISGDDVLPIEYLFRDFHNMPKLEQEALRMARGRVLDVGAGSGSHSLYLQNLGLAVKAIDISKGATEVCRLRGVNDVEHKDLLDETNTYDTILVLMNGTGIFKGLDQISSYLNHLKSLLKPDGQILIDSSDIQYMYEDEDGGIWIDINANYYGELDYHISYKGQSEEPMKWLYLDYKTLESYCIKSGLKCEMILEGESNDYLARLYLQNSNPL